MERVHLVLYDGVCGLCNRVVQFVLEHDERRVFRFASLQSALGRSIVKQSGGDPDELTAFYVVGNYQTPAARVLTRSDAVLFVACKLGWPWKAARLLRVLPRVIRDRAYDLVAWNRYQVFGRHEHCLLPRPEFRSRFVD
ncbi:MAG TPA: DCC1-like thiol-disulfide oxidoreductase family protein [Vicinamibacterales bacterium]